VYRSRRACVLELEQGRRDECRSIFVDALERRRLGAAADDRGLGCQAADAVERGRLLNARHQRAHPRIRLPRVADLRSLELLRQRIGNRVGLVRRHEDPADRGAFLPGLDGHLAHDLAHEGVESRAPG
jgi:hypothetical protein